MRKNIDNEVSKTAKPSYEFDGRVFNEGRASPLCNIKIWLPLDCHEDALISISSSSSTDFPAQGITDTREGQTLLVSEIDSHWGLEIKASNIFIGNLRIHHGMKTGGVSIFLDHIGSLKIRQKLDHQENPTEGSTEDSKENFTSIYFLLSDLDYGQPFSTPYSDYHGNRKNNTSESRHLKMRLGDKEVIFELYKHWNWQTIEFGREITGSCPAFHIKGTENFQLGQLETIQRLADDACVLLTLAARHLTVIHVMVFTTDKRLEQNWINPLGRQRSTTVEGATGPLIKENLLSSYFDSASRSWDGFTPQQKDAIRLAIFALHPFSHSSIEGNYLQMFAALEGVARAWFPNLFKINKKIEELIKKFPPYDQNLWPIIESKNKGLDAIRNHLSHGYLRSEIQHEAILVARDHLQLWIERIILRILAFQTNETPQDWLSRHVKNHQNELPRLQSVWQN